MTRRPKRRPNLFRIILLLILIGAALYINQVVVPATPPLFVPTATQTRSPESFINQAEELLNEGKLTQAADSYKEAANTYKGRSKVKRKAAIVNISEYLENVFVAESELCKIIKETFVV